MKQKIRLDNMLVENNLVASRSLAQKLIMAGDVKVDGNIVFKPSLEILPTAEVTIVQKPRFVSRAGEKLEAAINTFQVNVRDRICADVGASTGGFTDCLIQHGAQKVYAIDVGKGIMDWSLRNHSKVILMEKVNARYLESLPEAVSLVTIDVSFISLKLILPNVIKWFDKQSRCEIIALVKPQFEVGRKEATRYKGVIRDPILQEQTVQDVLNFAESLSLIPQGFIPSPILGQKGNREFLIHLVVS